MRFVLAILSVIPKIGDIIVFCGNVQCKNYM